MGFFSNLQRNKSSRNALPRFSRSRPTPAAPSSLRQRSSLFARCSRPSSSAQLSSFIYGYQVKILGPQPFRGGRTRSVAERVVEAIKREQVCDKAKPKMYLVIAFFCSMLAILFAFLHHIAGRRLKWITSEYNYVPSLDRQQGSSFSTRCSRPTLLGLLPCASPSSSVQLCSFQCQVEITHCGSKPFQAGRTRSIADRVVEEIKDEQVRDKEKTKHDQCSRDRVSRSWKMQVWRNLDHGSPSWTVRLEGLGWQVLVLDCPDLTAVSLPGRKISVSPESLNFCETDAETATVTALEVGHTVASHEAEMLVQDLCRVIEMIQTIEEFLPTLVPRSMLPKIKMIVEDHRIEFTNPELPLYLAVGLSTFTILFACFYWRLHRITGRRLKQIGSILNQ